jgi:hypothetical protein
MPAKDIFHDPFKTALLKDGWKVTHDPFNLKIGKKTCLSIWELKNY